MFKEKFLFVNFSQTSHMVKNLLLCHHDSLPRQLRVYTICTCVDRIWRITQ